MTLIRSTRWLLYLTIISAFLPRPIRAAEMAATQAWEALPKYEPGQDLAPLLAIDREVIAAMQSPQTRAACAAKLASLLTQSGTTFAARQYICLQLRQVGTATEVPQLKQLLDVPETAEIARYALESIPGREATAALRAALKKSTGIQCVGLIGSVAKRNDTASVAQLVQLVDSTDPQIASAAIQALGDIADATAMRYLLKRAEQAGLPTPRNLAVALLRSATNSQHAMDHGTDQGTRAAGKSPVPEAESSRVRNMSSAAVRKEIYTRLSQPGQHGSIRRAALEGLLQLRGEQVGEIVGDWFCSDDPDRRRVATSHLQRLSDRDLDNLLVHLANLPRTGKLAVMELAATRRGAEMLPTVRALIESSDMDLKLAGIRCLGKIGDLSTIPCLVDLLAAGGDGAEAARLALGNLPRKQVTAALVDALRNRPSLRGAVIDVLIDLKSRTAIDPLLEIAAKTDPTEYGPALDGLRGLADPDKTDISKLVQLLLVSTRGKHRDEIEKTILIVSSRLPAGSDRSELVRTALAEVDPSEKPKYLPLLGRLGGSKSLEVIETSMRDPDKAIRDAAIRALCNWPNADVSEQLLALASHTEDRAHRRRALRAYIRVISLKSDRPDAETLAMLQHGFALADRVDEKCLAITRAATVRTMATVTWIAQFLDDPELAQAACQALVELAHHRLLRHPNMKHFGPILEKVANTSDDPTVVERAKRYRLGL